MAEIDLEKKFEEHLSYVKDVYGHLVEPFLEHMAAHTLSEEERRTRGGLGLGANVVNWHTKLYPVLARISSGVSIGEACKMHRLGQASLNVYRKLHKDTLNEAVLGCIEDGFAVLEAEARRRAVDGVTTYVTSGGKIVLDPHTGEPITEQKYSDNILMFLMRAKKPEVYGERRSVDLSGSVNVQGAGETLLEKLAPIFAGLDELLDDVDSEGSEKTPDTQEPEGSAKESD